MMRDPVRDHVSNQLVDVVGEVIRAGIGPNEFKRMCVIAWREAAELIVEQAKELED